MIGILITLVVAFILGVIIGKVLLPVLHALKAGQSIREIGPSWHASKNGTPTMGGILFIVASLVCIVTGIPAMRNGVDGNERHVDDQTLMICNGDTPVARPSTPSVRLTALTQPTMTNIAKIR